MYEYHHGVAKDDEKAAGYDLLKILDSGLTREVYDAIAKTANEVSIPFVDGTAPFACGSISTACRSARAAALKIASIR